MKYHFNPGAWAWSGWALVPWEAPPISLHTAHAATLEIVIIRTSFVGMRYVTLSFHTSAVLLEINLVTTRQVWMMTWPEDNHTIEAKAPRKARITDNKIISVLRLRVAMSVQSSWHSAPTSQPRPQPRWRKPKKLAAPAAQMRTADILVGIFETIVVVLSYWSRDNVYRNIDKIRKCLAAILSQQIRHRYHTN